LDAPSFAQVPSSDGANPEEDQEIKSIKRLELCSAVWSSIAFILGLVMLGVNDSEQQLWWTVIQITEPSFSESSSVSAYFNTWQDVCPSHNTFPVNISRTFENSESEIKVNLNIVIGQQQWSKGYHPLWILICIFFISSVFQAQRGGLQLPLPGLRKLFNEKLPNQSVEFTRWLEYALTSPLQIWLVYSSFFMGDFTILLYAALTQAGLVLLGALIEHFYYKACKKHIKHNAILHNTEIKDKTLAKRNYYYLCVIWVSLLSWMMHLLLWIPIFITFTRLDNHFETCYDFGDDLIDNWRDVKWIVYVILYTQFFLFTSFGLVSTKRVLHASSIPPFKWPDDKDEIKKRNRQDAKSYAWLSVTAKIVLDIFFITLIFRFKQVESTA